MLEKKTGALSIVLRPHDAAFILVVDAQSSLRTILGTTDRSRARAPKTIEHAIKTLSSKKREGFVSVLENAPLRSGVRIGEVVPDPVIARCLALLAAGKTLSEHAIINHVGPFLKSLSRASDVVNLINQIEEMGAAPICIERIRGAIQDVGWEEVDGSSSAFLRPNPAVSPGPWSW